MDNGKSPDIVLDAVKSSPNLTSRMDGETLQTNPLVKPAKQLPLKQVNQ